MNQEQIAFLQGQEEQLRQQMLSLGRLAQENEAAKKALENLSSMKSETLFQLGSGVFAKGKITDDAKVLVELGGRVIAEKTVEEAKKMLEERRKQLEKAVAEIQGNYSQVAQAMEETAKEK